MKKFFRIGALAIMAALTITSCSDEGTAEDVFGTDDIFIDDDATEDEFGNPIDVNGNSIAEVRLTEGGAADDKISTIIEGEAGGVVTGLVVFTSESKQRRLYVTQTLPGESAMPFEIPELSNRGTKADGSIDLDGETREDLEFAFTLNVPNSVEDGSILYNFWSTTGKGDFRDPSKRLLLGVASIEVRVGDGVGTTDAAVREFENVNLFAPDSAGLTATFFSLLDGNEYKIIDGPEFRFFWDFGYYYPNDSVGASFSSTSFYGTAFPFPVAGLEDTTDTDEALNQMFFALSSIDYDSVLVSSDLDNITSSGVQNIEGIGVGSTIEFVDNYGKKGLINITGLVPGFGNNDNITFDVKIQP